MILWMSIFFIATAVAKLPPDLTPCQYEDTLCVSRIASDIVNNNPNGRSDMGLPPLDPYKTESIIMNEGNNGTLSFDLRFNDVEIRGISALEVERVVGFGKNPAKSKFEFYAHLPKIEIRGNYIATGRILFLPIQGNGTFSVMVEKIKGALKFKPKVMMKNGKEYLLIEKMKIRIQPEKANIDLENLFNGDKQLSRAVLDFINQNWVDVWGELSQPVLRVAENTARDIMQSIFDRFSYNDFFTN